VSNLCAPSDPQICSRTCGPDSIGTKTVNCVNGGYVEETADCSFDPSRDYSCYSVPAGPNVACGTGVLPQAAAPCQLGPCVVCNSEGGVYGGLYFDSSGATRLGFCVCATRASGVQTWSCAANTSWPCPAGAGCGSVTGAGGSIGIGGASGRGGATGAGGTGGTGGTGGPGAFGQPACPSTVAKGGTCLSTDVQFCYKTCGPEKSGVKSETCTSAGTYAEMSGCSFDPGADYACYKIPAAANALCPPGVSPMTATACDVPACTLCNSTQGLPGGGYFDSAGATHVGYCVCQAPNVSGARVWSCASDTAWPCPAGSGC